MLATRLVGLCRLASIIASAAGLFACGGGGGGGGGTPAGPSFTVSPSTLNFSALANAAAPLAQPITATVNGVSGGTLFFRVTIPGGLVDSVTSVPITGPNTGQAFVTVVTPATLSAGPHSGTISVVACTTDASCSGPLLGGSPQTVTVNYTVNPTLQGDAVAPYVVSSGVPGEVVLRGTGLASLTSVAFGASAATSITQVSTTEVRASYPSLLAGTYPVQLQNASGPVSFSGNLVVVDPPAYAAATLTYPASPGNFRSVVYDAARHAILVATDTQILRYVFSTGTWQAPVALALANLRDITLSLDGASLLTATTDSVKQLDPVTLGTNSSTSAQVAGGGPPALERIVVANDGNALLTQNQFTALIYPTKNPSVYFAGNGGSAFQALPAAGDNGSLAVVIGGLSPPNPILKYVGSTGLLTSAGVALRTISVNLVDLDPRPAVDRSGTRVAFNSSSGDFTGNVVFDGNMSLIGALPGTTATVAFAPNPAGSAVRAYTLDSGKLRAFDLTSVTGGNIAEITTAPYPITLSASPGNHPRMVMTPDGGNAILGGDTQVVIVQTP